MWTTLICHAQCVVTWLLFTLAEHVDEKTKGVKTMEEKTNVYEILSPEAKEAVDVCAQAMATSKRAVIADLVEAWAAEALAAKPSEKTAES